MPMAHPQSPHAAAPAAVPDGAPRGVHPLPLCRTGPRAVCTRPTWRADVAFLYDIYAFFAFEI